MKFLCMHGAIANPDNFKVQLQPVLKELEPDCEFVFAQGTVDASPPPGFEEYFGRGPHWRFLEDRGMARKAMLERIRDFPEKATPEETLREIMPATEELCIPPGPILEPLYKLMEEHGDIEGVIGYSEGAIIAATLMLDEQQRADEEGRPRQIKCGLFFGGWPPLLPDGQFLLADERDDMLESHTIHCIGSADPWLQGSMALFNLCDEDTAYLFDHGKGHTLPRDQKTCGELADIVRSSIAKIRAAEPAAADDDAAASENTSVSTDVEAAVDSPASSVEEPSQVEEKPEPVFAAQPQPESAVVQEPSVDIVPIDTQAKTAEPAIAVGQGGGLKVDTVQSNLKRQSGKFESLLKSIKSPSLVA